MLTGPKATAGRRPRNKSLSKQIRETEVLLGAWHAIRQNGETSRSQRTREETIAEVRPLGVVVDEPRAEIVLQYLQAEMPSAQYFSNNLDDALAAIDGIEDVCQHG